MNVSKISLSCHNTASIRYWPYAQEKIVAEGKAAAKREEMEAKVGRCRLDRWKPTLKAPGTII
jgi:hypothetical protein